jgi:hypothetical protein
MNTEKDSFRFWAVLFSIVALLPSLACIYCTSWQPLAWEKDSSGFYYFYFFPTEKFNDQLNSRRVELRKTNIQNQSIDSIYEFKIFEDSQNTGVMNLGAARFLPQSGKFVWLQQGPLASQDILDSTDIDNSLYLIKYSFEKSDVEAQYPLNIQTYDVVGSWVFSPVKDIIYYINDSKNSESLVAFDIAQGEILSSSDLNGNIEPFLDISKDGNSLYWGGDDAIYEYSIQDKTTHVVWNALNDPAVKNLHWKSLRVIDEYLLIDNRLYEKNNNMFSKKPFRILNDEEEWIPFQNPHQEFFLCQNQHGIIYLNNFNLDN